ncbi:hypothetical protein CGZ95_11690 [Enemella evansiae]|uniref:hypothetical protein n=1 Tax=Enemella evansiae TaxID=2016499 RepID=UPI000B9614F0|nr:hypothetical protein [Enemella evansiae]OYN98738.1 hypothetical protein CGZ95_11690 [Enemella evansiae]
MLATVLGVLGVVLNQLFIWPQVARARRSLIGISPGTVVAGWFARLLWSVYAVVIADWTLALGQLPIALGFGLLALLLARGRPETRWFLLIGLLATGAVTLAAAYSRPLLAALAVGVAAVVNLPQLVGVLRDPHRVGEVSPLMYWLVAAASATWLGYGLLTDWVISLPHFLLLPSGIVVAVIATRGRREPEAETDLPGPA